MSKNFVVINKGEITKRRLRAMALRIENPEPAWPRVGRFLSMVVRRQFSTKGAYLGTPWKPLKPEYMLWKVAHGYPKQTLVMDGTLRRSFVDRPMKVETYRGKSASFGSDLDLAIWHQRGTRRNGKQVNPPRPMLVVNRAVAEEVTDIMRRYIRGRGAGVY